MGRGRPAKSEVLHELHGTRSAVTDPADSHVVESDPECPKEFKDKPELRRVFKNVCRLQKERRALSRGDVELIRVYCYVHDRHRRNIDLLRGEGEVCEYQRLNNHGESVPTVTKNVRLDIVVNAEKQMAAILTQLGMSPTSKDRSKPTQPSTGPRPDENGIIPGSMRALHPEWFSDAPIEKAPVIEITIPPSDEGEQE